MKAILRHMYQLKALIILVTLSVLDKISWAQEKSTDINVNISKGSAWYTQPWVWIVGGAVFILLLAAIMRGGGRDRD
jgi:apolipoprotein N-acyltransferase